MAGGSFGDPLFLCPQESSHAPPILLQVAQETSIHKRELGLEYQTPSPVVTFV